MRNLSNAATHMLPELPRGPTTSSPNPILLPRQRRLTLRCDTEGRQIGHTHLLAPVWLIPVVFTARCPTGKGVRSEAARLAAKHSPSRLADREHTRRRTRRSL